MSRPWFQNGYLARRIPPEAIRECTQPGQDASPAVVSWIKQLNFTAPPDDTRAYLRTFGAWDDGELTDNEANLRRLFWILCGNLREDPTEVIYLDS